MSFEAMMMLGTAALVLALASSYLLWFGPAARKPLQYKAKEVLGLTEQEEAQPQEKPPQPEEPKPHDKQ